MLNGLLEAPDTVVAFDKASARTIDVQGYMHVEGCNISKAAVNMYLGKEIPEYEKYGLDADTVYGVLRPAEELKKATKTFDNLPLIAGHVALDADELENMNVSRRIIGSTGTDTTFDGKFLKNTLVIWKSGAIDGVESKAQHQISCGYRYKFVKKAGVFDGVPYIGYMTNIVGNHVALVEVGRAGPEVVVADEAIAKRSDTTAAEGEQKYGAVEFADEKNKKYPIDTKEHAQSALSYWGRPRNRAKYSKEDQATITNHIRAAAKHHGIATTLTEDAMKFEEVMDVRAALYALDQITMLLEKEQAEKKGESPEQVAALTAAIANIKKFIVSEVQEDNNDKSVAGDEKPKKKQYSISPQGQVVRGALLAYLTPRLATDAAIELGELSRIVKSVAPGRYPNQVDGLVGVVLDSFKDRLASELNKEELKTMLSSLGSEFANDTDTMAVVEDSPICDKCKKPITKGVAHDCVDSKKVAAQVSEFSSKHKLSQDAAVELAAFVNAQLGISGDSTVETTIVKTDAQKADEAAAAAAANKPEGITQATMDAALIESQKRTTQDIGARFQAAKDVEPFIGAVDPLAADSAESIYKLALDHKKVNIDGVHPSAYKALLSVIPAESKKEAPVLAADAAAIEDFNTRYPSAKLVKKG